MLKTITVYEEYESEYRDLNIVYEAEMTIEVDFADPEVGIFNNHYIVCDTLLKDIHTIDANNKKIEVILLKEEYLAISKYLESAPDRLAEILDDQAYDDREDYEYER